MGIFRSKGVGSQRIPRRSVRFIFAAMTSALVIALLLVAAMAMAATAAGAVQWHLITSTPMHRTALAVLVTLGLALVIVVLTLVIAAGSFGRQVARDLAGLDATARHLSEVQLPRLVDQLRRGEEPGPLGEGTPDEVTVRSAAKTADVARAADAVAALHRTAASAATQEAALRAGIGGVFVSLARRNQSLLQRQLRLIDSLERKAPDPAALADLFPLDHLTTRMRRHAESLIILAGAAPGRSWSEPVPVIDVIRGAVAEVEDYKRVQVMTRAEDAIAGSAVADMIHLLAELIENATLFSPSGTRVEVRAERVANGFTVEVDDRGLGVKADQLAVINGQLAQPPDFDLANADRLGLFVVGKLAARHGVRVSLRPSPYGGTSAIVLLPASIVVLSPAQPATAAVLPSASQPELASASQPGPAGLALRSADALTLTGRHASQPSLAAPVTVTATVTPAESVTRHASAAPAPAEAPAGTVAAAAGPAGHAPVTAGTHRGLPRRVRQANLSPHLRDSPAPASVAAEPLPAPPPLPQARTPEEARSLVASMQQGWQRGRRPEPPAVQPEADGTTEAGAAGPSEPESEDA